ncbi:MAG TPA: translation elongation factor Ts [Bacilli bacterium]|nr:translation elongation factor Ts [Bacilli bacterium]
MATLIELIKVLRETTGAGMMDCKKALQETNNDVEAAKDWLREKGITTAAKKQTRIAAEGLTIAKVDAKHSLVLELNCETDFVARGDAFIELVNLLADLLLEKLPATKEEADALVNPILVEATVKIGEKLSFRRFELVEVDASRAFAYVHMGGKISSLVVLEKANEELARGLAMHIAANNPRFINLADVSPAELDHEKAIQLEAAKNDEKLAGKPAAMLEKIIEGKVRKTFAEVALLEQVYLLDGVNKVADVLKQNANSVQTFYRFQVGEGIEKKKDDFAAEVMAATK